MDKVAAKLFKIYLFTTTYAMKQVAFMIVLRDRSKIQVDAYRMSFVIQVVAIPVQVQGMLANVQYARQHFYSIYRTIIYLCQDLALCHQTTMLNC